MICDSCSRGFLSYNESSAIGVSDLQALKSDSVSQDGLNIALQRLQNKIKELEYNKGSLNSNFLNKNGVHLKSDCNETENKTILNFGLPKQNKDSEVDKLNNELAKDALEMAEKRCETLERQLTTMRRMFLNRIIKEKTEPKQKSKVVPNKLIEEILKSHQNSTLSQPEIEDDEAEEECNSSNDTDNQFKFYKNGETTKQSRRTPTVKNRNNDVKTNKPAPPIKNSNKMVPFLAGTTHPPKSHSLRVSNTNNLRPKGPLKSNWKLQEEDTTGDGIFGIYFELCRELDVLLDKKMKLLDVKCRNLKEKVELKEVSHSVQLKKEQIERVKTLIDDDKSAGSVTGKRCNYNNRNAVDMGR